LLRCHTHAHVAKALAECRLVVLGMQAERVGMVSWPRGYRCGQVVLMMSSQGVVQAPCQLLLWELLLLDHTTLESSTFPIEILLLVVDRIVNLLLQMERR
jgi:hypothetical protein